MMTVAHHNSIWVWIGIWQSFGLEGLLNYGYGTHKTELENHAISIKEIFERYPSRSIEEAILKIKELTGIERSYTRIRVFMRRHGFRFLKSGHVPAKVNNTQQRQWVEKELQPVIEAAQRGDLHLLFVDAAHFILHPFLCCLWCVGRVFLRASAECNRINVLGAANAITKEVTTYTNTTYICVNFIKQLREKKTDKPIAIVLDNAR